MRGAVCRSCGDTASTRRSVTVDDYYFGYLGGRHGGQSSGTSLDGDRPFTRQQFMAMLQDVSGLRWQPDLAATACSLSCCCQRATGLIHVTRTPAMMHPCPAGDMHARHGHHVCVQGPLAVYLNAAPLQSYTSGIISSKDCGANNINHGVPLHRSHARFVSNALQVLLRAAAVWCMRGLQHLLACSSQHYTPSPIRAWRLRGLSSSAILAQPHWQLSHQPDAVCPPWVLPAAAVVLVGYDSTAPVPFWILKNSWVSACPGLPCQALEAPQHHLLLGASV